MPTTFGKDPDGYTHKLTCDECGNFTQRLHDIDVPLCKCSDDDDDPLFVGILMEFRNIKGNGGGPNDIPA